MADRVVGERVDACAVRADRHLARAVSTSEPTLVQPFAALVLALEMQLSNVRSPFKARLKWTIASAPVV